MVKQHQRNLQELLDSYRDYLLSRVSKVRILGEPGERRLKDVFVELSINNQRAPKHHSELLGMMDSAVRQRFNPFGSAQRDEIPDQLGREKENKLQLKPDDLLRRRTRAIVTGAPGCGKTTLLKYLAHQAQEKEERLVMWLELKSIAKPVFARAEKAAAREGSLLLQELWLAHLTTQLPLSDAEIKLLRTHLQEKFRANEIAVFLDGFDELQDETVERSLNKCISEFTSAPYHNVLLISTRPYAQHKLGIEFLQELEIEPLNQGQIEAFLDCYYPNDPAAKNLLRTLRERPSLRGLLHVPLLLGMILRLYREDRFTNERLELYDTIIRDLLHELDRSKSVSRRFKLNERLRLDFFKFLAFEQLLREPVDEERQEANRILFSYDTLRERATGFLRQEHASHRAHDVVEDALASPLLREVGADSFAFAHLTLHECLAARAFAAFYKSNEFEGLRIFCRSYHNPILVEMEVLPMMLGAIKNAEKIYSEIERWPESLTFANLRLRARGLAYSAKVKRDRSSIMVDRLTEFISEQNLDERPYRDIVIKSFAGLNPDDVKSIEVKVAPFLMLTDVEIAEAGKFFTAAAALQTIGSEKAVDAYAEVLSLEHSYLCYGAAIALGQIGSERAVDALIAALSSEDEHLRSLAAEELGKNGSSKAVDPLIVALQDDHSETRMNAAYALEKIRSEKAVDPLIGALNDKDRSVRSGAASALGTIGSGKATNALVSALNDEDEYVSSRAVDALGQIASKKAVDGLISGLRHTNEHVRSNVAEALARIIHERRGMDKGSGEIRRW